MATTLTATTSSDVSGQYKSSGKLTTATDTLAIGSKSHTYLDGSGNNQANTIWSNQSAPAATPDTIDLTGGITDIFGTALTLTRVKYLEIRNQSTTSGDDLTIAGNFIAASVLNGTAPSVNLPAGGKFIVEAPIGGFAVTVLTADTISVDPGAKTITYDIIIVGVT